MGCMTYCIICYTLYSLSFFSKMQGVDFILAIRRLTHEYIHREYMPVGRINARTVSAFVERSPINELKTQGWIFPKKRAQNQFSMGGLQCLKGNFLGINDQFNGFCKTRGQLTSITFSQRCTHRLGNVRFGCDRTRQPPCEQNEYKTKKSMHG